MASYNVKTQSAKVRKAVNNVLEYHEHYKNAYFWTPPSSASGRRSLEKKFADSNPSFEIIDGNNNIYVSPDLSCSAKNVYYHLTIKVNNAVKDVRAIKKYLK